MHPCPACGFVVFAQPPGSYDICPICGWEDDEVQLRYPTMRGGANDESLYEWQQRIIKRLPPSIQQHDTHSRDSSWRPLRLGECQESAEVPRSSREYFDAISAEPARYYWQETTTNATSRDRALGDSTT